MSQRESKPLEKGGIIMNRNHSKHPDAPSWDGRSRLPDGTNCTFSLWRREARESGQQYLGGVIIKVDDPTETAFSEQPKGDIALFENDRTENAKRPALRGSVTFKVATGDVSKFTISLWDHQSPSGKFYAGQIEDTPKLGDQHKAGGAGASDADMAAASAIIAPNGASKSVSQRAIDAAAKRDVAQPHDWPDVAGDEPAPA